MECEMGEFVNRLNAAYNHLDCAASPEDVDIAIYEITAAELALSRYLRTVKQEGFV
jgi:hypothetical protein